MLAGCWKEVKPKWGYGLTRKKCNRWCGRQPPPESTIRMRALTTRKGRIQEEGGQPQSLPGLVGGRVGMNECQPDKGRWEVSQDTEVCGARGGLMGLVCSGPCWETGRGKNKPQQVLKTLVCNFSLEKPPGELKEKMGRQFGQVYPLAAWKVGWGTPTRVREPH